MDENLQESEDEASALNVECKMMPDRATGFQTYQKTPLMLSMLGGIVGDEKGSDCWPEKIYRRPGLSKHPSAPWLIICFFMNQELGSKP